MARFCGNCGIFLNWPIPQWNQGQQGLKQEKTGMGSFLFISLIVVGILIGVAVTAGIISHDSAVQTRIHSAVFESQSESEPQPQTLTLATPVPLSPGVPADPGQTIDTITPSFQWNAVSNADYYSLIISKFPYDSGNIICTPPQLAGTSLIVPEGVLEFGKRYRWAIEAHSKSGQSSISNAMYFQTPASPPSPPPDSASATAPATSQPATTTASPSVSAPPWTPVTLPGWTPI
jgi:hypothetical protein